MKKLKAILLFSFVALAISCDEDRVVFDNVNGSSHAGFGQVGQNFTVMETDSPSASVRLDVTTVSNVARTFAVTVDPSSTATPDMYTIDQSTFTIPAGAYNGNIQIQGHFNTMVECAHYKLVLNLVSVDGAYIDPDQDRHTIVFSRHYTKNAGGTYNVEVSAPDVGDGAPSHVETFEPTSVPNAYHITSSWGPNFVAWAADEPDLEGVADYFYGGTILINCDNTVTFTADDDPAYFPGGSGTFDPATGIIDISYGTGLFGQPGFTTESIFTPVP